MLLRLHRLPSTPNAQLGILLVPNLRPIVTLEPPWKNNQRNISCVPTGAYELSLHNSSRFGRCFILDGVPNRDGILIHSGNTRKDTEGCILVGYKFGYILGEEAVLNSKEALNQIFGELKLVTEELILQIL